MKTYLAIKFYDDFSNRAFVEEVAEAIEQAGHEVTVMVRDHEKWGTKKFSPPEMMSLAFTSIRKADALVVEFSEKGVGLGIVSGYAHAIQKPIIVVAKEGSDVSSTLQGIASKVFLNYEDLTPRKNTQR